MNKNLIYILLVFLTGLVSCNEKVKFPQLVQDYPRIYPDYLNVKVPSSIAPLNFMIKSEKYDLIDVVATGKINGRIHVQDKEIIQFPEKKWSKLLEANSNSEIQLRVSLKSKGEWKQYKTFSVMISALPIDYGIVYRLISPGYEVYSKMGIYQRNLSGFDQKPIVENTLIPGACVNCHAFNRNNPANMSLHLRGSHGATMLQINGQMEMYNTKTDSTISSCVYPYWHPSGNYIAYSTNMTNQAFHVVKDERVEVFDQASDITVYNIKTNELLTCNKLKTKDFETYPVFSADGKTLYFCSSKPYEIQQDYKKIKYSLCKIDFDPDNGTFGNTVDTLISSSKLNKSVSFPRPSFDGKYIMFTLSDYGNFSIWHREADLYLLNLSDGTYRPLSEVNSDNTESFHDWSSNSHWFVFSSRRGDGLYTRLYIASIDEDGKISKPFLLPQKDPRFYDELLFSYNVPEFITEPVKVNLAEFEKKAVNKERKQMNYKRK
ncbi:MAG: TolB family protein [Paludibacteraceae bacterium]